MKYFFEFLTILCGYSMLFGQAAKRPFSLSSEFLLCRDISMQTPDNEKAMRQSGGTHSGALNIMASFHLKKNLWLETGYRYKEHWLQWHTPYFGVSSAVEAAHSIPLKLAWQLPISKPNWANRFLVEASAGILLDKIAHSFYNPNYNYVAGNNFITTRFDPEYENKVGFSASLEGSVRLHYRLYRNLYWNVGYGYVQGIRTLSKGSYVVESPGVILSGSAITRGTYGYFSTGLRVGFDRLPKENRLKKPKKRPSDKKYELGLDFHDSFERYPFLPAQIVFKMQLTPPRQATWENRWALRVIPNFYHNLLEGFEEGKRDKDTIDVTDLTTNTLRLGLKTGVEQQFTRGALRMWWGGSVGYASTNADSLYQRYIEIPSTHFTQTSESGRQWHRQAVIAEPFVGVQVFLFRRVGLGLEWSYPVQFEFYRSQSTVLGDLPVTTGKRWAASKTGKFPALVMLSVAF